MKSVLVRPSVLIRTALTAKNSESYTKKSNVPKSMKGAETRRNGSRSLRVEASGRLRPPGRVSVRMRKRRPLLLGKFSTLARPMHRN